MHSLASSISLALELDFSCTTPIRSMNIPNIVALKSALIKYAKNITGIYPGVRALTSTSANAMAEL